MTATDCAEHITRLISMLASDVELDRLGVVVFPNSASMLSTGDIDPYPKCCALDLVYADAPTISGMVRATFLLTVRAPTRDALAPLVFDQYRAGNPFGAVFDALARCRPDLDGAGCAEWVQRVARGTEFAFGRAEREAFHESRELVRVTLVP